MGFIYLLTPCLVLLAADSVGLAGSPKMLVAFWGALECCWLYVVSVVDLHSSFSKRNVGARRCCLSCRSYKLSFCALQLPNAKSLLSLI